MYLLLPSLTDGIPITCYFLYFNRIHKERNLRGKKPTKNVIKTFFSFQTLSVSLSPLFLFLQKKGARPGPPPKQPLPRPPPPFFVVILAKQDPAEPRPEAPLSAFAAAVPDLLEGPAGRGVPLSQGAAQALYPVVELFELGLELGDPGLEL